VTLLISQLEKKMQIFSPFDTPPCRLDYHCSRFIIVKTFQHTAKANYPHDKMAKVFELKHVSGVARVVNLMCLTWLLLQQIHFHFLLFAVFISFLFPFYTLRLSAGMLTAFLSRFILFSCALLVVSQGEIVKLLSLVSFLFLPCGKTFALSLMLSHVYEALALFSSLFPLLG
jgi:hypothetical protein